MKPWQKFLVIVGLLALPPGGLFLYSAVQGSGDGSGNYQEIDWRQLRKYDYKTGEAPAELSSLEGQRIKIPGFVVPLDDDTDSAPEFLLVPSPQACVHVPPPPPNQMILVKMEAGQTPSRSWGPVWVKGKLRLANSISQYGKISFRIVGEDSEKYQVEY